MMRRAWGPGRGCVLGVRGVSGAGHRRRGAFAMLFDVTELRRRRLGSRLASNRFREFRGVGTAGLLSPSLQSASAEEASRRARGEGQEATAENREPTPSDPLPRVTPTQSDPCPE